MSLGGRRVEVHAQRQAASASLIGVTLARHVALGFIQAGAASQLVTTEALVGKLCTGQTEPCGLAVCHAPGVGDLVSNIRKRDTGEDAGIEVIGKTAFVGPASWDRG